MASRCCALASRARDSARSSRMEMIAWESSAVSLAFAPSLAGAVLPLSHPPIFLPAAVWGILAEPPDGDPKGGIRKTTHV